MSIVVSACLGLCRRLLLFLQSFSRRFEHCACVRACVCVDALHVWRALEPSASSVHDLLLPPGRSSRLGSAGRMLMISCKSPAVLTWFSLLYVRVHMFGVPAWLCGLDLVISTGKFYVFVIFRCVLMGSVVSVVVSVSFQMSGMSLCHLDASDRFSSPPLLLCRVHISNIQSRTRTVAVAHSSCLAGV